MKEIVVISGKGGTGKTSITASFACLGGADIVVADCDVDAADMHLLMKPDYAESEDFYSGHLAVIDQEKCTNCGACAEICRWHAITAPDGQHIIAPLDCEGCGYCARICPTGALSMVEQNIGRWFISGTKANNKMVHARLGIGAENSGKMVAEVKNKAKLIAKRSEKEFVLVDGSPGIGCPVVSSLSGANLVVLVTEPSCSGLHDLKRVYQLVKKFRIKACCIINKEDINSPVSAEIQQFLKEENITHIASLPYDENFTKAMTNAQTIVEYGKSTLKNILTESWEHIKKLAEEQ